MGIVEKPKAIVLGGTNPHKELILNLQNRGYYVILIDYYENPPAKSEANEHIQESTLDENKVLEIAKEKNAKLVIATCIDQANVTACYVGEKLGLPIPYSYATALNVSDKAKMKDIMTRNNIPTSKYLYVESINELSKHNLSYPLVVKPADSNSSKGVRRVDTLEELTIFFKAAKNISRNGKVIVEEFVTGDEIGIDCIIKNNEAHVITLHKKRKPALNNEHVIYSIGSISPPEISTKAKLNIQEAATKIALAFDLNNTPLLIQAIVKNDTINVIEFAPRIGGGLNFRKIKEFADYDIIDAAVDSFEGKIISSNYKHVDCFYSENHVYANEGIFESIVGWEQLKTDGILEDIYFNKQKGAVISTEMASSNRIGSFIVKANSIGEVRVKIRTAIDTLCILNPNGENILKKEIYKDLLF